MWYKQETPLPPYLCKQSRRVSPLNQLSTLLALPPATSFAGKSYLFFDKHLVCIPFPLRGKKKNSYWGINYADVFIDSMGSVPKKKVCRHTQPVLTAPRLIFFPPSFLSTTHGVNPFQPSNERWAGAFFNKTCVIWMWSASLLLFCHVCFFHLCTVMHLAWSSLFSHSLVELPASSANRVGAWSSSQLMPSFASLHYVGLLAILPQDNRSLRGVAQPGHQQWQSPTNLLTETNLFDMAVQDMDQKSPALKKKYIHMYVQWAKKILPNHLVTDCQRLFLISTAFKR